MISVKAIFNIVSSDAWIKCFLFLSLHILFKKELTLLQCFAKVGIVVTSHTCISWKIVSSTSMLVVVKSWSHGPYHYINYANILYVFLMKEDKVFWENLTLCKWLKFNTQVLLFLTNLNLMTLCMYTTANCFPECNNIDSLKC